MCDYCNPDTDRCCVWKDSLTNDFYLDIETSEWDEHDDGFVHQKEYISYCPYCGRKLIESKANKHMKQTEKQKISAAIELLKKNGYVVKKDYTNLIGKWVAFYWNGMMPILHGKVCSISNYETFVIKCKNAGYRFISINDVIDFFDNKKECYMVKNKYN